MTKKDDKPNEKKEKKNVIPNRFFKGTSGNARGRPSGIKGMTAVLKDLMDADEIKLEITTMRVAEKEGDPPVPQKNKFHIKSNMTMKYAVNVALINKALRGDIKAIEVIYDRMEGKALQTNLIADGDKFKNYTTEEKQKKLLELFSSNDK